MTTHTPVWLTLFYEGEEKSDTQPFKIKKPQNMEDDEWDIDALKKAVKSFLEDAIGSVLYIKVYPAGASIAKNGPDNDPLEADKKLFELEPTTSGNPLIVVAQRNDATTPTTVYQTAPPSRPLKKAKTEGTANTVDIKTGMSVEICTRSIVALNDKRLEKSEYFGREGTEQLFKEMVMSRQELEKKYDGKYNISLIGNPGAGKSNLAWAVAHHVVNHSKDCVLWMSRREAEQTWTVYLFEWDEKENAAYLYNVENAPTDVDLILADELTKKAGLLILDSPTKSKTGSSRAGIAAFEWASTNENRRVIHVSSLGAFSVDGRILNEHFLVNKRLNPWHRRAYIESLRTSAVLKQQVIDSLVRGDDKKEEWAAALNELSPEGLVDMKFFFCGINARWFYNYSIKEIKDECRRCVSRMPDPSNRPGEASDSAVNSVSVNLLTDDNRTIEIFTSAFMVSALSDTSVSNKFLHMFPLVADRLGNGSPGEAFEFDFCAHVEHTHNMVKAQRYLVGDTQEKIDVEIGTDVETELVVRWQAGELLHLPKGKNHDIAAQPMPEGLQAEQKKHYWFIPEDKSQPFLDFFLLQPENDDKWTLRVIQNTISKKHGTDLKGFKSVICGIEGKGFDLQEQIDVVFVISDAEKQARVGAGLSKSFDVILTHANRPSRSSEEGPLPPMKSFSLNLSRVRYLPRASSPS